MAESDRSQAADCSRTEHAEHIAVQGPVGILGDNGHIDTMNVVVTAPRAIIWPVLVGLAPALASAYEPRAPVRTAIMGQPGVMAQQVVLTGGGGVGKSQIAAGLFHDSEADLRMWISAESRASVVTGYTQAARRLGLGDLEAGNPQELVERFLSYLQATERTWLLVLDDLADPADLDDQLWPTGPGRLLVTTRRRDASLSGGGRTVVNVDAFTPEEAAHYLYTRLVPVANRLPKDALGHAHDLAEDLGRLPLGLAQAAAVIINQGLSCAEYRRWFADKRRHFKDLFPPDASADGYSQTVGTTWELAVDAADEVAPVGMAWAMAWLVAVFDPAGVPEFAITSDTACELLARLTESEESVTPTIARGALRALDRFSLADHDPQTDNPRAVRMHSLTGRAILESLPSPDNLRTLVEAGADSLMEVWPNIDDNTRAMWDSLRSNAEALHRAYPDGLWYPDGICHPLLRVIGEALHDTGAVAQAARHYEELLKRAREKLDATHPFIMALEMDLAIEYRYAGSIDKAIQLYERILARRALAPHEFGMLPNNLAIAYMDAGHPDKAIPLLEEDLASAARTSYSDDYGNLNTRITLGSAYRAAGHLEKAITLFNQARVGCERLLGPDDPETLRTQNNLASAYQEAGNLGAAISLFEETVAGCEHVLGFDHLFTLRTQSNLASAYRKAGELGAAISLFEGTVAGCVREFGFEHPDTLTTLNNLASAYQEAGDLDKAITLFNQTLAGCVQVLSSDHPETFKTQTNLASAYQEAGDLDKAVALFNQTLAGRERSLGPEHPDTLQTQNDLASAYYLSGRLDQAISLLEQNVADCERVLGPDHSGTRIARNNLAQAREKRNAKSAQGDQAPPTTTGNVDAPETRTRESRRPSS